MHDDPCRPRADPDAPVVRDYLQTAVDFFSQHPDVSVTREGLVLRYGRPFQGVPWETWRGRGWRRRKAKHCFKGAWDYSYSYSEELTYVEGYAYDGRWPEHHAWCITADQRVVDPTWHDASEKTQYFGIPFPAQVSAELFLADKGCHLDALIFATEEDRQRLLSALAPTSRPATSGYP